MFTLLFYLVKSAIKYMHYFIMNRNFGIRINYAMNASGLKTSPEYRH